MTVLEAALLIQDSVDNGVVAVCPDTNAIQPDGMRRLIRRLNEATAELLVAGIWVGSMREYILCTTARCFTLPREIEAVVEVSPCGDAQHDASGGFYTLVNPSLFLDPALWMDDALVDRGEVCTFADICGACTIRVYADLPADAGAQVRWEGTYNGGPVYVAGALGETLTLPAADVSNVVNGTGVIDKMTRLVKSPTQGYLRVYAVPTANPGNPYPIAFLAPDELEAKYRRYYYPALDLAVSGQTRVRVTGVKRFIPITSYKDELILSNVRALKLMMQSIWQQEQGDPNNKAEYFRAQALENLTNEVKRHILDPRQSMLRKAQYLEDQKTLAPDTMGYLRARIAIESEGALNYGASQLARMLREAQEKLIVLGKFDHSLDRLEITPATGGWVTLPDGYDAIVSAAADGRGMDIEGRLYEFNPEGPGVIGSVCGTRGSCQWRLVDEGWQSVSPFYRQYRLMPSERELPDVVQVMAKRAAPPTVSPSEKMPISYYPAVKAMMESIFLKKAGNFDAAAIARNEALSLLSKHAAHLRGGAQPRLRKNRVADDNGMGRTYMR